MFTELEIVIQCLQWPMFWASAIISADDLLSATTHPEHQRKKPLPTAGLSIKSGFTSQTQNFSKLSL